MVGSPQTGLIPRKIRGNENPEQASSPRAPLRPVALTGGGAFFVSGRRVSDAVEKTGCDPLRKLRSSSARLR